MGRGPGRGFGRGGRGARRRHRLRLFRIPGSRIQAYFGLSDKQLVQIKSARRSYLQKRYDLKVKIEKLRLKIRQERLDDKIDTKRIGALQDQIQDAWQELDRQRDEFRKRVINVLTPEQKQKLPPRWQ